MPCGFSRRLDQRVERRNEELSGVAKHDIRTPLHLMEFFHIPICKSEFAVLNVWKLVNDQVGVVSTEVVDEHGDLVIYRSLKITLLISSGDEPARNVVAITHFGVFCILVTFERLATNVAVSRIIKLLLLNARKPIL